ncbi:hypothetical protein B0H19DRAFT_1074306 [Mycena capillaripes]|nr:hypothetical protein B0H19DRAFT_1074306 [Mycena capillaripes]
MSTVASALQRRSTPQYLAPQASYPVPMSNFSNEVSERSYYEASHVGGHRERTQSAVRGYTPPGGRGGRGGGSGDGGPGDGGGGQDEPGGGRQSDIDIWDGYGGAGGLGGRGGPGGIGGDPEDLVKFLTSGWLNLTVVTQPDMRSLIKHPALRNIIAAIAREAMDEVMIEMRQAMERKVWEKMDVHLNPLAKNTAAYSLNQLTAMDEPQMDAYNGFAPKIGARRTDIDGDVPDGPDGPVGPSHCLPVVAIDFNSASFLKVDLKVSSTAWYSSGLRRMEPTGLSACDMSFNLDRTKMGSQTSYYPPDFPLTCCYWEDMGEELE